MQIKKWRQYVSKLLCILNLHRYDDVTWWTRDFEFRETTEWRGMKCNCGKFRTRNFVRIIANENN
jgi:hypothetical protein